MNVMGSTSAPSRDRFPLQRISPLVAAQTLFQCGMSVDLTLTGLVGYRLSPTPTLATLPFAAITLGAAAMSGPASLCVKSWGYRRAFVCGAGLATVGGLLSALAIHLAAFPLFVVGTLAVGFYQAFANYYRYAAAEDVPSQYRGRAISTVLAGGILAAVAGPFVATAVKDTLRDEFAGSYVLVSVLALASGAVLSLWRGQPGPSSGSFVATSEQPSAPAPRFAEIARRPIFLAGVGGTALGYSVMMLLMTAAPIAATQHHHTIEQGAFVVQWHMVGMFAPSLFSGWIIGRMGSATVVALGIVLSAAATLVDFLGTSQAHFMLALLLVGVGWNFMYVAGSTLIAHAYQAHERTRVQATGELLTMAGSAVGALSAGALLNAVGWTLLNALAIAPLLLSAILTGYYAAERITLRRTRE